MHRRATWVHILLIYLACRLGGTTNLLYLLSHSRPSSESSSSVYCYLNCRSRNGLTLICGKTTNKLLIKLNWLKMGSYSKPKLASKLHQFQKKTFILFSLTKKIKEIIGLSGGLIPLKDVFLFLEYELQIQWRCLYSWSNCWEYCAKDG